MRKSGGSLVHPGGDLYEELKRCGGHMPEGRVAGEVIRPCLSALSYLHAKVRLASGRFLQARCCCWSRPLIAPLSVCMQCGGAPARFYRCSPL